ncbi:hypothetical protein MTO96_034117 [Rhipicephalus appendiculatus]
MLALNNVSITTYETQVTILLGHNGAGKTTLMSILTGLIEPNGGSVLVSGMDIRTASFKRMGFCPQFDAFFADLTVSEHLKYYGAPLPPINQHGERKCYNCNIYGHIARDCPEPKRPLKCQRCQSTGHTQRNCKANSSNESNVGAEAHPCTGTGHVLIKEVILNDDFTLVGLIDTGSSGCLLRASAAARCGIEMVLEPTDLYGFGSENHPVTRSLGHCKAKVSIDGVVAENIPVLIVPDDAQRVDILVGRTFTELPSVTYAKVGSTFRFYHLNDCPFVHLVSPAQQPELHLKAPEECTLQKNAANYVTTSSDRSVTTFRGHCGRDGLPEWKRGENKATVDDPEQLDWDVNLKQVECSLNNAISKSTGKSPFEMLHGYKPSFYGVALQQLADLENPWQPPEELRAQVLILDEPTVGLDPETRRSIWSLVKELRGKASILLSTHDMEEADVLGDRIIVMYNGSVVCWGSPSFLKKACGVGYKLRIEKERSTYQSQAVLAVVRNAAPEATVEQDKENEAVMSLNTMQRDGFPTMFRELEDGSQRMGVRSIGVSVATMKDAYIR